MSESISIIVASFNKEKYVVDTINSVLSQKYRLWELLFIDDASTDSTLEKLKNYSSDPRIKIIKNEYNRGANYCRNLGIKTASGKYILFLDADDLLHKECLAKRLEFIKKNPTVDFAVFSMAIFDHVPGDRNYKWIPASENPLQDFLKHDLPWTIIQPLWKKDFLSNTGGFDESFKRLQDVELHTRILLNNPNFQMVASEPDCFVRVHEERKNYNPEEFIRRWVESSLQYYHKFLKAVTEPKPLLGTLFQVYVHLLHTKKSKKLDKKVFKQLENNIISTAMIYEGSAKSKIIFCLTGFYGKMPFRIPGINTFLKKLLIQ